MDPIEPHPTQFFNETDCTILLEGMLWGQPKSVMIAPQTVVNLGPTYWDQMRLTRIVMPEPVQKKKKKKRHYHVTVVWKNAPD